MGLKFLSKLTVLLYSMLVFLTLSMCSCGVFANEKSNDTTNENRLCRRPTDTRDLKSLSGDRVRVRPPSAACKSPESFVDPNDSGLFLRSCGFLTGSWSSWQHKRAGHCKSCKKT